MSRSPSLFTGPLLVTSRLVAQSPRRGGGAADTEVWPEQAGCWTNGLVVGTRTGDLLPRTYKQVDIQLLFGKSRFHCAFPECKVRLLAPATPNDPEKNVAQIAHIVASSETGPRADPTIPSGERDRYANLILLCAYHHNIVDGQPNTYSIEDLKAWKQALERWVDERLSEGMTHVHFLELETVCDAMVRGYGLGSSPLTAVPPREKMAANELTDKCSFRIGLGLSQAPQVADFLGRYAAMDHQFPERLRAGFVEKYRSLYDEGLRGDALFFAVVDFAVAAATSPDDLRAERWEAEAAALAVICHLFQICDLFEAPTP